MICRPSDQTAADYCPITSFAFDLSGVPTDEQSLYTEVQLSRSGSVVTDRNFYYSKSVVQHGINNIRLQGNTPCKDPLQFAVDTTQSYYFAEMVKMVFGCKDSDPTYQKLPTPTGMS